MVMTMTMVIISAAGEDGDGDSCYVRLCVESLACYIL